MADSAAMPEARTMDARPRRRSSMTTSVTRAQSLCNS
jgi:hypothetical protein